MIVLIISQDKTSVFPIYWEHHHHHYIARCKPIASRIGLLLSNSGHLITNIMSMIMMIKVHTHRHTQNNSWLITKLRRLWRWYSASNKRSLQHGWNLPSVQFLRLPPLPRLTGFGTIILLFTLSMSDLNGSVSVSSVITVLFQHAVIYIPLYYDLERSSHVAPVQIRNFT